MEKKNLPWWGVLACAGTYFGLTVNAAFMSGGMAYSYFAKFGWCAIFFPILSMALIVFMIWQATNAAANRGCRSARQWADWAFHPYEKIFGPIFDVITLFGYCLSCATGIAGMGQLLNEWLGFSYTAVCIVYTIFIVLIAVTNASVVSKFGGIVSLLLVVCMLFVYPAIISQNSAALTNYVSNRVMFDDNTIGGALWQSLVLFGFQGMSIGGMMALRRSGGFSTRRDAKWIMIIGGSVTTVFLVLSVLAVLNTLPESASGMPLFTAINAMNSPRLLTMYRLSMLLALATSNGPGLYGMAGRWAMALKKPLNHRLRMLICAIVIIAISYGISTFGLTAIIAKGWAYMGTIGIFLYGIPVFTSGLIRTIRDNKRPESEMGDLFEPQAPPESEPTDAKAAEL